MPAVHMTAAHTDIAPQFVDPATLPFISDDECLVRLAAAIEIHNGDGIHDGDRLEELALLIGRLAVPIE